MASPRAEPESTPICRCRVLYLGSAVPHVTKDGLQGIQEPLRELYPEQGALGARGIDSWLSVWSNGLLLENVDENHKKVTRFFPIDSLHYCAAVRYVLVPEKAGGGGGSGGGAPTPRFLPLDSPFARTPNPSHPPLFAAILRRTTGIKVLECHAFICKREMAANALVRCCFHAYADSSYARHMDGVGGSNYGTLRSHNNDASVSNNNTPSGTLDKVDGWRRLGGAGAAAGAGSTLSLNSHQNHNGTLTSNATMSAAVDDISIYNGDENHKVWVGSGGGSVVDREELYGGSYTMRSSRSTRPRQVVAPVNAPPPPPTPKDEKSKKMNAAVVSANNTKERTRRKKQLSGSREELFPMMNGGGGSLMRGAGRSASSMSGHHYSNGTLMRPTSAAAPHPHQVNGFHHPHHYHPHQMPPPPMLMATLPGRPHHKQQPQRVVAGTFSHRPPAKGGMVMNGRPIIPAPFVAIPHPHPVPIMSKKKHHHVEEPIYMPSARPLSPVASFQPGHFPHEAYLMQQYANNTMDHGSSKKKKGSKSEGKHSGKKVMGPPAMMVNGGGPVPVPVDDEEIIAPPPVIVVEESPFNTGIYRKKGHLNERAFSYSIRQEHRSRSYGSLANLKFAGPEIKKEREIAQMMHDLELSGDELERSEVPPPAALRANSRR